MTARARRKEAALEEGLAIARDTITRLAPHVQGVQVSAPFGRVDLTQRVLEGYGAVAGRDAEAISRVAAGP